MSEDLSQYKDLYLQTGKEYLQALNTALLTLEKSPAQRDAIEEIFRNAHSLKSQSAAMGYEKTGYLCHAVEDVFFEIKEDRMKMTPELADVLFTAFDELKKSIDQIETENKEIDLSPHAETLKKLTGVKTEGAGKSERGQEKTDASAKEIDINSSSEVSVEQLNSPSISSESAIKSTPLAPIKTIAVKVSQMDEMMDLLEELMVHRLELKKLAVEFKSEALQQYQDQTEKIIQALWFQIMKARAVPVKMVFDHFPRAVRDLARVEKKQIDFTIIGDDLELDRTIVDRLDEPLIHLIRNAVSHGIEASGAITLSARREKDHAIVEVSDNGLGIDWEKLKARAKTDEQDLKKVLFSGISTSEKVTQVSGRGVGLAVVKKTVEEFGGSIDVTSEKGKGTTFILKFPLTLAISKTLIIRVGTERYAVPAITIDRSVTVALVNVRKAADQEVFVLEEQEIPLLRLADKFGVIQNEKINHLIVVVVFVGDERVGLVVDEVVEAAQMIIKPVPDMLKSNTAFAGVTILGDGRVALLLNPQGLL